MKNILDKQNLDFAANKITSYLQLIPKLSFKQYCKLTGATFAGLSVLYLMLVYKLFIWILRHILFEFLKLINVYTTVSFFCFFIQYIYSDFRLIILFSIVIFL